jgi:hypothetical protein
MKLPHRRQFLHLATGAAALSTVSHIAWAQTYPTRPVRLILGYAPGGAPDIVARLIGEWLSQRFGQPFIIENRPGGPWLPRRAGQGWYIPTDGNRAAAPIAPGSASCCGLNGLALQRSGQLFQ